MSLLKAIILSKTSLKSNLISQSIKRGISVTSARLNESLKDNYKLVIVGGGTGGLSTGSKFLRKLGKGQIALVDAAQWHCNDIVILLLYLLK